MLFALRILLVEDDEDDQLIFLETARELCPDGLISIARNGKDALELLEAPGSLPDVVFLDINMPMMNGLECLRRVRLRPEIKDIPVYILSTSPSRVSISVAQKLGANGYLTKPFSRVALCEKLAHVLELVCSGSGVKESGFLELTTHEAIHDGT